jgi:hypothetical protein
MASESTKPPPTDARHLTVVTLNELWKGGVPLELPIEGDPTCRLQLDPQHGLIRLLTAYQSPEPDVAKFKNMQFRPIVSDGTELAELTVQASDNVYAAYGLLASIADDLQTEKQPLSASVATAVLRHRSMLITRGTLTLEQEIGLFGELLFLEFLIDAIGAEPAVLAWHGAVSEEHDFIFDAIHIEVKTTVGEQRKHIISGLAQLVPVPNVPLSLLSIQLTRSTASGARSLPELVAQVRQMAAGHSVRVDAMLTLAGWTAEDADLYDIRWTLRAVPCAYRVKGAFPALTPNRLAPVVPNFALVSDVSYKVDLTNLGDDGLPGGFAGFVGGKQA